MTGFTTVRDEYFSWLQCEIERLKKAVEDRDKKISELIRFQEQELCFKPVWRPISELTEGHKDGRWLIFWVPSTDIDSSPKIFRFVRGSEDEL